MHPPGRSAHLRYCSNKARIKGSPRGLRNAGVTTKCLNSAAAVWMTCTCNSSLERKCAKSPLLDRPSPSASRPRVTPWRPNVRADTKARRRMVCRVDSPLRIEYKIARPVVLVKIIRHRTRQQTSRHLGRMQRLSTGMCDAEFSVRVRLLADGESEERKICLTFRIWSEPEGNGFVPVFEWATIRQEPR